MSYSPKPLISPTALVTTLLVGATALGLGFWAYEVNHEAVMHFSRHSAAWLRHLPWPVFYLAVAVLPFAFFPISLLYLSAGAVHGLWPSLAGILVAMAVNISLSYWLASGPLRDWLARWFSRRGRTLPVLPPGEHVWAVLVVRFTPAFPLIVQNYLLGLARIPFWTYFWTSLAAEAVVALGYILAGEALTKNHPGYVLTAFACIVGAVILSRLLRHAFARKVHPLAAEKDLAAPGPHGAENRPGEP